MEEKELFEDYEHKVWEWTPKLYKIIGFSVIANFLGLLAIAQLNIFTTRGCDTPYVGVVCQALDSAYIASVFMGKGFETDSREYGKTEIGDDEVVTIIDVSDRLEYPEGYFALANPEQVTEVLPVSDFSSLSDSNSPISTPNQKPGSDMGVQVLPTPNEDVAKQDFPDTPFDFGGSPKPSKPNKSNPPIAKKTPKPEKTKLPNESPKVLPDGGVVAGSPKPTPSATPTPDANAAKEDFNRNFNRKPLQDFADGVLAKVDSPKPEAKVDLKQSFKVVLDGTLTKDGKFDAKKTRFVKGEGNEQMVNVAKDAIEAMGDSNLFSYLQTLGVNRVSITLVQDERQISAVIRSNQQSEENAKTVSSGFNGLLALATLNTKDDAEVQSLIKATKFNAEGKSFVINFIMPKDQAHQLIDKKLQESRQKKPQTNSGDGIKESATAKGL